MILTRYLYSKERVLLTLLKCLSLKLEEESLYFAYELNFSGFELELWDCLWKHYFLYCHVLNPEYEQVLKKQEKIFLSKSDMKIIKKSIVELIIRPYHFIGESEMMTWSLDELTKKYKDSSFNPYNKIKLVKIYNRPVKDFDKEVVISRIVLLESKPILNKKQFFIDVDKNECDFYKTKEEIDGKVWKVLRNVIQYNVLDYLSKEQIKKTESIEGINFVENWIIYAYNSPLWKKRIESFHGKIINNKLVFEDEDMEEEFWIKFNLEPDEQPADVQNKLNFK